MRAVVLDRLEWVDSNLASMQNLLDPLMQKFGERLAHSPFAPIGRKVAAAELGALLGYVAQRVLGQYDLLVPDDRGEAVYYVGANVLGLEKRFAFRPARLPAVDRDPRGDTPRPVRRRPVDARLLRVARAPGVRARRPRPATLARALSNAVEAMRRGQNPLDEGGLVSLIATPEQRGVLGQVQALMSLLEGHGNIVMTELGRKHVAGEDRMARVLHQRRQAGGLVAQLHKMLGLEQKMRQYEVGEKFVQGVIDIGGPRAIDHGVGRAECLPVLDELDDPGSWLARVQKLHPAGR